MLCGTATNEPRRRSAGRRERLDRLRLVGGLARVRTRERARAGRRSETSAASAPATAASASSVRSTRGAPRRVFALQRVGDRDREQAADGVVARGRRRGAAAHRPERTAAPRRERESSRRRRSAARARRAHWQRCRRASRRRSAAPRHRWPPARASTRRCRSSGASATRTRRGGSASPGASSVREITGSPREIRILLRHRPPKREPPPAAGISATIRMGTITARSVGPVSRRASRSAGRSAPRRAGGNRAARRSARRRRCRGGTRCRCG